MDHHQDRLGAVKAERRIYVSCPSSLGAESVVHTSGFATLDREIPVESYITATAFARELRVLAERFPDFFPERRQEKC